MRSDKKIFDKTQIQLSMRRQQQCTKPSIIFNRSQDAETTREKNNIGFHVAQVLILVLITINHIIESTI